MKELFPGYSSEESERINYLIKGYVRGRLTREENISLDNWVNENDNNMQLFEQLTDPAYASRYLNPYARLLLRLCQPKRLSL